MRNIFITLLVVISVFIALNLTGLINISLGSKASSDTQNYAEVESEDDHDEDAGADSERTEALGITLTSKQKVLAGIGVTALAKSSAQASFTVSAETQLNSLKNAAITSPFSGVITQRYKQIGDHVSRGDAVMSLQSPDIVAAFSDYRLTNDEWQRVQELGSKIVSQRRMNKARFEKERAFEQLKLLGFTASQISSPKNTTSITLRSPISGVVLAEDFVVGSRVMTGDVLSEIANEDDVWVEAKVPFNSAFVVEIGTPALVEINGKKYRATTQRMSHQIDEATRTKSAFLKLENSNLHLDPGIFASATFLKNDNILATFLPESALVRSPDGDWMVFLEIATSDVESTYQAQEVDVQANESGQYRVSNLPVGSKVVTKGAFFIASEQAKSGFDPHNH